MESHFPEFLNLKYNVHGLRMSYLRTMVIFTNSNSFKRDASDWSIGILSEEDLLRKEWLHFIVQLTLEQYHEIQFRKYLRLLKTVLSLRPSYVCS